MTVLIALGGNAMTAPDGSARPQDQRAAIGVAAESIADIVAAGSPVVLTHGNGPQVGTAVVISRTLVDPDDRGFANPTKPIGRYLPAAEAADLIAHGQTWRDFGPPGWRRVVASPEPLACLDAATAAALLAAGFVVVCAGGGGVPTVWGTAAARPIGEIPVAGMRALAGDGHFPAGSMGPKVEAACRFAEGGGRAIITSLRHIGDALAGKAGTAVIP